jgi:hypothetical protein
MPEWVPIIFSICLAVCLRPLPDRLARITSAGIAIVLLASCAFVASGECYVGWTYFLLDLVQTSFGFAIGAIAVQFISPRSNSLRRKRATAD